MGIGFRPTSRVRARLGIGLVEPFDRIGFVAKTEISVSRNPGVNAIGRLGGSEGLSESAGAVGATLKFP